MGLNSYIVLFVSYIHSEDTQSKVMKVKDHVGYIRRKSGLVFQDPLPVKLHTPNFSSKTVVTTPVKCLLLGKLIRYSVTRTFAGLCVERWVPNVKDKRWWNLEEVRPTGK